MKFTDFQFAYYFILILRFTVHINESTPTCIGFNIYVNIYSLSKTNYCQHYFINIIKLLKYYSVGFTVR